MNNLVSGLGDLAKNGALVSKILDFIKKNPNALKLLGSLKGPMSISEIGNQTKMGGSELTGLLGKLTAVNAVEKVGENYKITDIGSKALGRVSDTSGEDLKEGLKGFKL